MVAVNTAILIATPIANATYPATATKAASTAILTVVRLPATVIANLGSATWTARVDLVYATMIVNHPALAKMAILRPVPQTPMVTSVSATTAATASANAKWNRVSAIPIAHATQTVHNHPVNAQVKTVFAV